MRIKLANEPALISLYKGYKKYMFLNMDNKHPYRSIHITLNKDDVIIDIISSLKEYKGYQFQKFKSLMEKKGYKTILIADVDKKIFET